MFIIMEIRYIRVLFHTLYHNWAEEYRSLYRGLRYKGVYYIEVQLFIIRDWVFGIEDIKNTNLYRLASGISETSFSVILYN